MGIIRITQSTSPNGDQAVEVCVEGFGAARQTAKVPFHFQLEDHDQENIRWYLEDYLINPIDPAPKIAAGVESRIELIGNEMFRAVFDATSDARDLWATCRPRLNE